MCLSKMSGASGATPPKWPVGSRQSTRIGWQRFVKPIEDSNLLAVCACWRETHLSTGAIYILTRTGQLSATTTFPSQKLLLSRSSRGSIALWLSSERTTCLSRGIETEAITPPPASDRASLAQLTSCSCCAKTAWPLLHTICFDCLI